MLPGLPLPLADHDTKPFWDGCNEGRFLLPRCAGCGTYRWVPGPMCPECQSCETDWIEWSGIATVYSWVVVHHPALPELVDHVPYVIALIELREGIRVLGNVAGCAPEDMRVDLQVELFFEEVAEGERLPNFRVAS
jgi:uncharacterized OB-fold protein